MNCPDVTLKCIKSHLYHVVSLSICDVFLLSFSVDYRLGILCSVYFCCLHVRLLCVTLNINRSIDQSIKIWLESMQWFRLLRYHLAA